MNCLIMQTQYEMHYYVIHASLTRIILLYLVEWLSESKNESNYITSVYD